jgi:hypothetical protein
MTTQYERKERRSSALRLILLDSLKGIEKRGVPWDTAQALVKRG